jgi:hypothetical protein
MQFTPDQLAEYNERGYVIIDCPFPETFTNTCLEAVEKVAEEPIPKHDGKLNHHRLRPFDTTMGKGIGKRFLHFGLFFYITGPFVWKNPSIFTT